MVENATHEVLQVPKGRPFRKFLFRIQVVCVNFAKNRTPRKAGLLLFRI